MELEKKPREEQSDLGKPIMERIVFDKFFSNEENIPNIVLPGDMITNETGYMNGHGTFEENGSIFSSIVGTVQQTNKLILVNPLRCNYNPQVGDIIVGRVVEINNKRWKIDINSFSLATLHLNSTYLPEQRIKTQQDELNMRQILCQNDLTCAQVHSINNDQSANLHTRSLQYGRIGNGLLVQVNNQLIQRQKHHFHILKCQVNIIFSHNGWIWLSNINREGQIKDQNVVKSQEYENSERQNIAMISNLLNLLNREGCQINTDLLNQLYDLCKSKGLTSTQIAKRTHQEPILEFVKSRIEKNIPKQINKLIKQAEQLGFN